MLWPQGFLASPDYRLPSCQMNELQESKKASPSAVSWNFSLCYIRVFYCRGLKVRNEEPTYSLITLKMCRHHGWRGAAWCPDMSVLRKANKIILSVLKKSCNFLAWIMISLWEAELFGKETVILSSTGQPIAVLWNTLAETAPLWLYREIWLLRALNHPAIKCLQWGLQKCIWCQNTCLWQSRNKYGSEEPLCFKKFSIHCYK